MRDPVLIAQFVQLDRDGSLSGVKAMLEPSQGEAEDRFLGEVAPYLTEIIGFCAALGTITKAVSGAADMVPLATKLANWTKAVREGKIEQTENLGLRERLLTLLFEATTNHRQGMSIETLRSILGCSKVELEEAIACLEGCGVARKSPHGNWKYSTGS